MIFYAIIRAVLMIKGETMIKAIIDTLKVVGLAGVSFLPTRLLAVGEVNTVTTPDIFFTHSVSNVPTKEALDFKENTVFSLHTMTSVMAEMLHNFIIVLGTEKIKKYNLKVFGYKNRIFLSLDIYNDNAEG